MEWIEANWIIVVVAVLAVVIGAWLLTRRKAGPRELGSTVDVLSPDAPRAISNRSAFDAPPDAAMPPVPVAAMPDVMVGVEEVVAASTPPIPAEPEPDPQPVLPPNEPTPDFPAPADQPPLAGGDDLSRIKGLGPKLRARLGELGVTSFAQIASWDDAELARIDDQLGTFKGRPQRDNWMEQARLLAANDTGAYEAKFGRL